jgi:hypothetical protein
VLSLTSKISFVDEFIIVILFDAPDLNNVSTNPLIVDVDIEVVIIRVLMPVVVMLLTPADNVIEEYPTCKSCMVLFDSTSRESFNTIVPVAFGRFHVLPAVPTADSTDTPLDGVRSCNDPVPVPLFDKAQPVSLAFVWMELKFEVPLVILNPQFGIGLAP